MDYDPLSQVKKFMLDEKIKEEIGDIESRIEKSIGSEYEAKKQRVKEKL